MNSTALRGGSKLVKTIMTSTFIPAVGGHQTNTYVFGAGGYRFSDFPKIGAPLNILLWIVASIFIPIFWPFVPKPHP